jgi:hypothetical protein
MPHEPPRKPRRPGSNRDTPPVEPGHLAEDDRGNITWQWANDEVLQADDTAGAIERLRALVDPSLDVDDSDPAPRGIENPSGLKTGYNPYESGALLKRTRRKKTDLRELSKWIETKRKLEKGSSGDPTE